jgi:hypothetical protein
LRSTNFGKKLLVDLLKVIASFTCILIYFLSKIAKQITSQIFISAKS